MIAIIDYEMGNLRSVQKAFERVGHAATITSDPAVLADAVEARAARRRRVSRCDRRRCSRASSSSRFAQRSRRASRSWASAWACNCCSTAASKTASTKGWAYLRAKWCGSTCRPSSKCRTWAGTRSRFRRRPPIFAGIDDGAHFYFVHSYYVVPRDASVVATETDYPQPFCSSIWRDNLFATQFHPEKSQDVGPAGAEEFRRAGLSRSCHCGLLRLARPSRARPRADSANDSRTSQPRRDLPVAAACAHILSFCAHRSVSLVGHSTARNCGPCKSGRRSICAAASASACGRATTSRRRSSPTIRPPWPGSSSTQGARHLHLVDLEGAREGLPVNLPSVQAILAAVDIECELGGGIRDEQSVIELLEFGLSRLVIGTSALDRSRLVPRMCRKYPGKLVLGIDARDGRVATDGWLQTSDVGAIELARQFADEPLAAIIYTDIATDGMLRGPNVAAMAADAGGRRRAGDRLGRRHDGRTTSRNWPRPGWPAASSAGHCTKERSRCRSASAADEPIGANSISDEQECEKYEFRNTVSTVMCQRYHRESSWPETSRTFATLRSVGTARPARPRWSTNCWSKTGAVNGQPSVDDGTSICDFDEEEKHHKHSIEASVVHFDHAGKRFNVIDTPGYPDLIGQTIGALRAVDTALIAIDAHAGIEVNTRRAWQEAGDAGLGRILVHHQARHRQHRLSRRWSTRSRKCSATSCVLFNVPLGHGHDLKGVVSTLDVPSRHRRAR